MTASPVPPLAFPPAGPSLYQWTTSKPSSPTCNPSTPRPSRRASARSGGIFDVSKLKSELAELEEQTAVEGFWNNQDQARKVIARSNAIKGNLEPLVEFEKRLADFFVLGEFAEHDNDLASWKE